MVLFKKSVDPNKFNKDDGIVILSYNNNNLPSCTLRTGTLLKKLCAKRSNNHSWGMNADIKNVILKCDAPMFGRSFWTLNGNLYNILFSVYCVVH